MHRLSQNQNIPSDKSSSQRRFAGERINACSMAFAPSTTRYPCKSCGHNYQHHMLKVCRMIESTRPTTSDGDDHEVKYWGICLECDRQLREVEWAYLKKEWYQEEGDNNPLLTQSYHLGENGRVRVELVPDRKEYRYRRRHGLGL